MHTFVLLDEPANHLDVCCKEERAGENLKKEIASLENNIGPKREWADLSNKQKSSDAQAHTPGGKE